MRDPGPPATRVGEGAAQAAREPVLLIEAEDVGKEFRIYPTPGKKLLELMLGGRVRLHDRKTALSGITFRVGEGTALGLVGPNGCGKSTLIKILAGIMQPTHGAVRVRGRIGAMLDLVSGFNMEFSGAENIRNKCALLGLSQAQTEARYETIVRFSGLGNRIDHPIKTYSSGMLLRLGFSTVIHSDFDVLLVDEVLFVGDEIFARQCLATLGHLKENSGKAIVVAGHSLSQLATFCDHLLYLDEGKTVMLDRADAVIQQYMMTCDERYSRIMTPICVDQGELDLCALERLGKVRMTAIETVDADGRPTDTIYCGDPIGLRIHYEADEPVPNPCVRVMFHTSIGFFVHGTNTYRQGLDVGTLMGRGVVELDYPSLPFLEGDYYLNVGIWPDEYASFAARTPYDAREYSVILHVHSRRPDGGGVVHVPNTWRHLKRTP
jgi:ABC-2 type transport system ATP-binding protein